jgi:FtsP/CotA-like multicopper oxidase with cupredoxin domain
VRASQDGLLDTTLEARLASVSVAGQTVTTTVYEGSLPGPTLRVRPGDRLKVKLVNGLTEGTSLHVHGLHVSPAGNGDNPFLSVGPRESFDYEFALPAHHPSGLYWYHPHVHHLVADQVFRGLAGAIIVEGELDRLPGIAGVPERLLLLGVTRLDGRGRVAPGDETRTAPFRLLVNGQLNPTLRLRPGETQRWRLGNISPDTFFRIQLAGHPLHQIATDGNALDAVAAQDEILLAPGKRAEMLVQGGAPGTYELRTRPVDKGTVSMGLRTEPDALLATLVVEGAPVELQPLPTTLLPFADLRGAEIATRRTITFQAPMSGMMGGMGGMQGMGHMRGMPGMFRIDGRDFDPNRVDQTLQLGATEEWVIRNASDEVHPFHIHVTPFQVVAINGQPHAARSYEDTVPVPPRGEITIRMRFLDFTGRSVYHCHILMHEDGGMMGVFDVV